MSVVTFTLIILTLYLFGMKVVSLFAQRISKHTSEDFFLSGRNVGLVALIGTTAASIFSTGTVVSAPSEFFSKGIGYFWMYSGVFLGFYLLYFTPKFWRIAKEFHYITPGDFVGGFYCSRFLKGLVGLIGITSLVPYATGQLVAIGKMFESLTAGVVSYDVGIIVIGIAIAMYLYFGGARAVIWTDVVQGFVFMSLLFLAAGLSLYWAGGFDVVRTVLIEKPDLFALPVGITTYVELAILVYAGFVFMPHVWQRAFMARSERQLGVVSVSVAAIVLIAFLLTAAIGFSGLALFPDGLQDADGVLGAIFNLHAPYVGAFILVAAFAAGMSTVDSQMLSSGSIVAHDIFPLFGYHRYGGEYRLGKIFTLFLLMGIVIWGLQLRDTAIFQLMLMGIWLNVVFIPMMFCMFWWKRSSFVGAVASLVGGVGTYFICSFTSLLSVLSISLLPGTVTFLVSLALFVAGSVFFPSHTRFEEYLQILS